MNDSVPFELPASFVLGRVVPTGAELAYGYRDGWLQRADVVEITVAKLNRGASLVAAEEEMVLLLADDLDRVDELIADLDVADQPTEDRARPWLFLALAWLWHHQGDFDDPLEVIELLYAEFNYPEEIRGLVRYMPALPGERTGQGAIYERWRMYLDRATSRYRERDADLSG